MTDLDPDQKIELATNLTAEVLKANELGLSARAEEFHTKCEKLKTACSNNDADKNKAALELIKYFCENIIGSHPEYIQPTLESAEDVLLDNSHADSLLIEAGICNAEEKQIQFYDSEIKNTEQDILALNTELAFMHAVATYGSNCVEDSFQKIIKIAEPFFINLSPKPAAP